MRLQVILHGGPYEGTMISVSSYEGDWPTQIRVAAVEDHEDPCMHHFYVRHDVDTDNIIFMGSYKFTHSNEGSRTLVDRWL